MKNKEELKKRIAELEYIIKRIETNMFGEMLASLGGRTTGHSNDWFLLEQYKKEKTEAEAKLKELQNEK